MASNAGAVRRRALLVSGLLAAGLLGLGYRAVDVAVVEHDHYTERGNRQQLRSYTLDASRGDIVDRSHIALAVNDRAFKIVLNPRLIRSQSAREQVERALVKLIPEVDVEILRAELERDKAYRQLKLVLSDSQAEAVRRRHLPGVRLEPVPRRVYPRKLLASHVLGRINSQGKGNLGIEYGMDEHLRGRDAMSPAFFARGKKLLVDGFPDPGVSRGNTLVLTIDSAIQAMAEEEINTLVENWHPVGASIVVLDPRSGEILAMTNRPTFDPNHRVGRLEQTVDLASQAAYEPGSTMKAITVAAALETGAIRPAQTFFCENGKWKATSEYWIEDTKPAEWLTVTEILAMSSNICTAKIYERIGKRALFRWVKKFHFGERPSVRLPGATAGLLAPWKKWSDIQAANISFGQGMSASPLQVAAAFATLANDGVYNAPAVVRRVLDHEGTVVWAPAATRERVVRTATANTVLKMLESVVQSRTGTGKNARIPGYRVAGKTSTAQKASRAGGYAKDLYYASFVGAVPAEDPRVVILVSVDIPEGGHYGNQVAAPTFARLGERVMTHLGVPREDGIRPIPKPITLTSAGKDLLAGLDNGVEPELPGRGGVRYTTGLPDFTGLTMTEALHAAETAEVRLRAVGTGIAVMQDLSPGPVQRGNTVRVLFEPPA